MAIYISGVKNLPEQVQKNKDDIEDLHTADTNLEAKIDQEIADRKALIEASGNATIIENPTKNVAVSLSENESTKSVVVFIDGTPKLNVDDTSIVANEDTAVNGDLVVSGNITTTDGDITTDNGDIKTDAGNITTNTGNIISTFGSFETSFGHLKGLALVSTIINVPDGNHEIHVNCKDSSNTNHVLKFDADTLKLTIDGNEVGGKQLYQHNIGITAGLSYQDIMLTLITYSSTPMTKNDVANYLYEKGFTSATNSLMTNQYIYTGTYYFARRIYATNTTTLKVRIYDEQNNTNSDMTGSSVVDQVLPI